MWNPGGKNDTEGPEKSRDGTPEKCVEPICDEPTKMFSTVGPELG